MSSTHSPPLPADYPIRPVPFTQVQVEDSFWSVRMETNRRVTIPYAFEKCEATGRIDNLRKAAGLMDGPYVGKYPFDDSDVFKIVEGAAYTLSLGGDPELERYLDRLIAVMAAAQEDDGYLYTARTLGATHLADWIGDGRWSSLRLSHELYNVGHLYEAAAAHYQATGKRSLLDMALKSADLVAATFGPGGIRDVPGHEEIEIGLVKLYRATGETKYLALAQFFLDERGRPAGGERYGEYAQDHRPVVEQNEPAGHAVRATYLYAAMADVAALTGDERYVRAIDRIWENVVSSKLYLTGGIGARRQGEAFGADYELPNRTAYAETCAAIGNALWNHRLFLLHGEAGYLDLLERILYNGFLAGVSMSGDAFFYTNPLESDGDYPFNEGGATRSPWFACSCCPSNVVRFLPSLPGYIYARRDDALYVNLYVAGRGLIRMGETAVQVRQETRYPWDGRIQITLEPERAAEFALCLRVPGWARNRPVPGDLYRYLPTAQPPVTLLVNRQPLSLDLESAFARIRRTWRSGDLVELTLPMPVRRVVCHEKVAENAGKVALERGPLVYCFEGADNDGRILDRALPDDEELAAEFRQDLLGGLVVLLSRPGASPREGSRLVAIPYYAWSHRGPGEMAVWLSRAGPV
jgi:DUF1680 family protein